MSALRAKASRLLLDVRGDQFHSIVEDPHQPAIPADPDAADQILRWHRVVRLGYLDVAVAMHRPLGFVEEGETLQRQRPQRRLFHFGKVGTDLLADGAVNPPVGHGRFPVEQITILVLQTGESESLEPIVLDMANARLDLALVPRRSRSRRQNGQTIVVGEGTRLRVQLGVVPVRCLHAGFEIVENDGPGPTAKVMKGVFEAMQKLIGRLTIDRLAISFA